MSYCLFLACKIPIFFYILVNVIFRTLPPEDLSVDGCESLKEALCRVAQEFNQACGIWWFMADTAEEMMSKQTTKDE